MSKTHSERLPKTNLEHMLTFRNTTKDRSGILPNMSRATVLKSYVPRRTVKSPGKGLLFLIPVKRESRVNFFCGLSLGGSKSVAGERRELLSLRRVYSLLRTNISSTCQ